MQIKLMPEDHEDLHGIASFEGSRWYVSYTAVVRIHSEDTERKLRQLILKVAKKRKMSPEVLRAAENQENFALHRTSDSMDNLPMLEGPFSRARDTLTSGMAEPVTFLRRVCTPMLGMSSGRDLRAVQGAHGILWVDAELLDSVLALMGAYTSGGLAGLRWVQHKDFPTTFIVAVRDARIQALLMPINPRYTLAEEDRWSYL